MRTISWYDEDEKFHEYQVDTDDVIEFLEKHIRRNESYRMMRDNVNNSSLFTRDECIAFREGYKEAISDIFSYYDLDDFIDDLCDDDEEFLEFIKDKVKYGD